MLRWDGAPLKKANGSDVHQRLKQLRETARLRSLKRNRFVGRKYISTRSIVAVLLAIFGAARDLVAVEPEMALVQPEFVNTASEAWSFDEI